MKIMSMLRTSEFWMAVALGIGQIGAALGFWSQEHFNNVLMPAIVYIIGRVTSKVAKAGAPPTALLAALALLLVPATSGAAEKVFKFWGAGNAVWYDAATANAYPADYEAGIHGRASLSPHITLVGATYYGFKEEYFRGSGGVRVTATDVDDKGFSVGFGIQYHGSSDLEVRPREWAPEAVVGWRPWLETMPKVIVGVGGNYGLTSKEASVYLAARYELISF